MRMRLRLVGLLLIAALAGFAPMARAQDAVELTPFAGYRFGGGFFELLSGQPVDLDGAPAVGVAFDTPFSSDLQIEGLFSHEHARLMLATHPSGPSALRRMSVDHWMGGGLRELRDGSMRPFLTGVLGLTRYATRGDSEIRFTAGAGGGVKLLPVPRVGLRLDGRVFATFVDADARLVACSPGNCFIAFRTDVVWQAEFTAGLVFRFY
jgi:hypothetical protein